MSVQFLSRLAFGFCFLSICTLSIGLEVNELPFERLNDFDRDSKICAQIGTDKVSKWLVSTGQIGNAHTLINSNLSAQCLVQFLQTPSALAAISADLQHGDSLLMHAFQQALIRINFDAQDAQRWIVQWARNGVDQTLKGVLQSVASSPEAVAELQQYLFNVNSDVCRIVLGVDRLLKENVSTKNDALQHVLLATRKGLTSKICQEWLQQIQTQHSPEAKWMLVDAVLQTSMTRHILWRIFIQQHYVENSFYEQSWKFLVERIAKEPVLVSEYATRIRAWNGLYERLDEYLLAALKATKSQWSKTWFAAAAASPQGRFAAVLNALDSMSGEEPTAGVEQMIQRAQNESQWSDLFFWHLTRAGEALVYTIRSALPEVSAEATATYAKQFLLTHTPFGSDFETRLLNNGACRTEQNDAACFREKVRTGKADFQSLYNFGQVIAQLLSHNDSAWSDALKRSSTIDKNCLLPWVLSSLSQSLEVTLAWAQTLQSNDADLNHAFLQWLTRTQDFVADPEKGLGIWLDGVIQNLKQRTAVNNPEVTHFKEWFLEFLKTPEGWEKAAFHLSFESTGLPTVLRESMIAQAVHDKEKFWQLLHVLNATEGVETQFLHQQMADVIAQTALPSWILEEIASQNTYALEAVTVLWEKLLAFDSPIEKEVETILRSGAVSNNVFNLGVVASLDLQSDTKDFNRILDNPELRKLWHQQLLVQVQFFGKGYIVGNLIKQKAVLTDFWIKNFHQFLLEDTDLMESLLESIAMRRIGDPIWKQNIEGVQEKFARILFENRILFEQLLTHSNATYLKTLKEALVEHFGSNVAQEWGFSL